MTKMRTAGLIIALFSFASLSSAQVPKLENGCSAPSEYPHTRMDGMYVGRQKFSSGEKVYYDCAEDFTPTRGNRAVQCVAGKWTKLTLKCEKRSCGNAGELLNGDFQYEGNSVVGEKVYAVCNEGYMLKGPLYLICKKNGWTGEFPSCVEGQATCSAPAVANSVSSGGDVPIFYMGDDLTFTCHQGFQLDGAQQIVCGPNGEWQPQPPKCLPLPKNETGASAGASGCSVPLAGKNANLADKYITKTSFASGERVHYVCDVGYAPAGGSRFRRCSKGKWTQLMLRCERKLCGSAGDIANGQFIYTGVEFGDTAKAVCDEGYHLVGKATRNCMSQGWDGRVPVCEAVVCDEPAEVANAEMEGYQEQPYTYRSVIRYRCPVGTLIGQREIWCTKDGTWSAPPPKCQEMTCPSPNVPRAFWMGAHNARFQYRDTISIECNPGYTLTGPDTITCERDGRWVPELPKCIPRRAYQRRQYGH